VSGDSDVPAAVAGAPAEVPFREAFMVWLKIGLLSFGGPAGQIALMHRILVDEKRWIGEQRFLHALNYCMLLPGPEAQQLTVYIGWLLHRTPGGIVAGLLFVLPGALVMLALSIVYALYSSTTLVEGVFFGIKAAVLAIVVQACLRIGRRALHNRTLETLAAVAFVAIFFLRIPFPWIVAGAALAGMLGARIAPAQFPAASHGGAHGDAAAQGVVDRRIADGDLDHTRPSLRRALVVLLVCIALWFAPLALVVAVYDSSHVLAQQAMFFSKLAVVTFGGAYAVLAYMAQAAVETHGWLSAPEMLDGLGLAESTPGPLIMVVQFVGFLGAYRDPGTWNPLLAGVAGAAITTWVTFVPCFLWIFLGAPYVERLRQNRCLAAALSAITAAVVGVILNIALWFALHVVFARIGEVHAGPLRLLVPEWGSIDVAAAALSVLAVVATFRFRLGMAPVFAGCALLGLGWSMLA